MSEWSALDRTRHSIGNKICNPGKVGKAQIIVLLRNDRIRMCFRNVTLAVICEIGWKGETLEGKSSENNSVCLYERYERNYEFTHFCKVLMSLLCTCPIKLKGKIFSLKYY